MQDVYCKLLNDQQRFIIQMSTVERKKLLDYLPPEELQKVLTLVQRLKEQTQAKEKYAALYDSTQKALNELTDKYNKLKDQNSYLKQQIHNSFSIVSQVRANFKANKQKLSSEKHKVEVQEEWQDDSQDQNQENKQSQANQNMQIRYPPKHNNKSPLQKYRPELTTSKKSNNFLNISHTDLNNTNLSASKSKEVEDLRKQVRVLQESKKKSQKKNKQFQQKRKLVDEIKNRYKTGESNKEVTNKYRHDQSHIEKIDVTDTFENDEQNFMEVQKKSLEMPKKQVRVQQVKPKQNGTFKNEDLFEHKATKNKIVTHEDYGDVLEMINSYNL